MRSPFTTLTSPLALLASALLLARAASAVNFTVTPSTVGNEYAGFVTLQISGLTNGESVKVLKYLDANANGSVDAGEFPVQGFGLTDGQARVTSGVTNLNVPGDWDATPGSISVPLSLVTEGFDQQIVGHYVYRVLSSSAGSADVAFTVTNSSHGQSVSGTVLCAGTNVPYATVMLFTPPDNGGNGMSPVAGTMADASGAYSLMAPAGSYMLWAYRSGYVADLSAAPVMALNPGNTLTTNLNLLPATQTISGTLTEGNTNKVLSCAALGFMSANNQLVFGFADTNGNFSMPVTSSQWQPVGYEPPLVFRGLVFLDDKSLPMVDATTGSVAGLSLSFPRGTALFYGTIKDGSNSPLPGVSLSADQNDSSGQYKGAATSDPNGNYTLAVSAANWNVQINNKSPAYAGYIFSQGIYNTNISSNQVVQLNFVGLPATQTITGWLRDTNGQPIPNVQVYAWASINGANFSPPSATTDSNGNYSLKVANGNWSVSLNCQGYQSLGSLGYPCVPSQFVTISNNSATANFIAAPPAPLQITTLALPSAMQYAPYGQGLTATGGQPPYNWWQASGNTNWPPGLTLDFSGNLFGAPANTGTYTFAVVVADSAMPQNMVTQTLSLTISAALHIATTSLPNATQNLPYSQSLNASGGQPPYLWVLAPGSASLPAGLALSTNGLISGTPAVSGSFSFIARVVDASSYAVDQVLTLTINAASGTTGNTGFSLTTPSRPGNGQFQFAFNTAQNANYTIQYCTSLGNWVPWVTLSGSGNPITVIDPSPMIGQRFYRVIKVGP